MNRIALVALSSIAIGDVAVACLTPSSPNPPSASASPAARETVSEELPVGGSEGDRDDLEVVAAVGAARGGAGLLTEAAQVLETMTASRYSHRTHIEGTVYDVDCSGFIDYLLGRADPPALDELRAATVRRPLAKHFVEFLFASTPRRTWVRIPRISDLAAGDIIAWSKPADVTSTNTGHVMLVAGPLGQPQENVWSVPVIDSTAGAHGSRDARKGGSGVGRGTIRVEADVSGMPVAYYWSEDRKSRRHSTEIVMGRLR